jgi:hypothetical protein
MLLGIRDRKVNECGAVLCTKTNGAWQRGRGHTPLKFFWDHGPGYCGGGVRVFHFDSFVYHKRTCVYEVYGVECAAALLPGLFRPPFVVVEVGLPHPICVVRTFDRRLIQSRYDCVRGLGDSYQLIQQALQHATPSIPFSFLGKGGRGNEKEGGVRRGGVGRGGE